jgi:hypothetical protein
MINELRVDVECRLFEISAKHQLRADLLLGTNLEETTMNEDERQDDPAPQDSGFGHFYKLRKIARVATKSGQGLPGSRSKDERRIRRQKRAQRSR